MKVIFLGTPENACPFLDELLNNNVNVVGVITQKDKPCGRKKIITPPPVKVFAESKNIRVYQPKDNSELKQILSDLKPDLAIVVAYGKILKKEVLDAIPSGFFNVHFSLLPKYRGADPVRRAILNMEKETGVTIFKITEGLDEGPILIQESISIEKDENSVELMRKLVEIGKKNLIKAVRMIESGDYKLLPQSGIPSYAPKITVDDTFFNFNETVDSIYSKIKAFSYDPRARFRIKYRDRIIEVQVIRGYPADREASSFSSSQIVDFEKNKGIFIKCSEGVLFLETVKPQGKNELNAYSYFINGLRFNSGDFLKE